MTKKEKQIIKEQYAYFLEQVRINNRVGDKKLAELYRNYSLGLYLLMKKLNIEIEIK